MLLKRTLAVHPATLFMRVPALDKAQYGQDCVWVFRFGKDSERKMVEVPEDRLAGCMRYKETVEGRN